MPTLLVIAPAAGETSRFDPVTELATRSKLPAPEISKLLADCDANQMSMNFCAWRDALVAEHQLDEAAAKAKAQSPACTAAITRNVRAWRQKRDVLCAGDAASEYGGGSMEPAAREQCAASMTVDYARHVAAPRDCSAP